MAADRLNRQFAGSNVTGTSGLVAIDKVGNRIRFYDPQTLAEIAALDAPERTVHELAFSADRRFAFAPLYGDGIYGSNREPNNKVLVIDLERRAIASLIDLGAHVAPHGMIGTCDGRLWVACDIDNWLLLVDPARGSVEESHRIPGKGAHQIALLPDETKLYVSNKEGPVAVFDIAARRFLASIPVGDPAIASGNGSGGEGLTPTPDGRRLLVFDNAGTELHVIDTASDCEIDRVALAMHPPTNPKRSRLAKLMVSPDGRTIVAISYQTGLAWVIDAADLRRQRMVPVAKGPFGIAFAADRSSALVSSHDAGLITRIELASATVSGAFDGGAGIECLAYY